MKKDFICYIPGNRKAIGQIGSFYIEETGNKKREVDIISIIGSEHIERKQPDKMSSIFI